MTSESAKVGVWVNRVLPPSETFILNQMSALQRWTPVLMGRQLVEPRLDVEPGYIVESHGRSPIIGHQFKLTRMDQRLNQFVKQQRLRAIHAHFGWAACAVMPTALRMQLPFIVTFHGADITENLSIGLRRRLYRRRLQQTFLNSSALIAVSDFIADSLCRAGAPPSKIRVHYIGVPEAVKQRQQRRSGILFVGRLVEKKGVDTLLEAVSRLPDPLRRTRVIIVGTGPLDLVLRDRARDLDLAADFVGHLNPAGVMDLMQKSALLCGPSRRAQNGDSEGLGMVFLEAARAALPVVASKHGGIVEVVEHERTGLLVPERNPSALAAALARLLTEPDYARNLGETAAQLVADRFDLTTQTAGLEDIYDEIVTDYEQMWR